MRETGSWETDRIVISSEEATGQASLFVYFQLSFETVHTLRSRGYKLMLYAKYTVLPTSTSITNIRLSRETGLRT